MKNCEVRAVPYDMPVIGYGENSSIGTLRLWQCESTHEFDFDLFNRQDYAKASKEKNVAEDITKLLYPNDTLRAGKLLRARQQYVLCSASLQDMLRSFRARFGVDYDRFADLHAVQLNDTHPTMAIPELIRLLMADGVTFNRAFPHRAAHVPLHEPHRHARSARGLGRVAAQRRLSRPRPHRQAHPDAARGGASQEGRRGHGRAGHRPRRGAYTWRTSPSTAPRTPMASPRSTPRSSSARSSASGTRWFRSGSTTRPTASRSAAGSACATPSCARCSTT